MPKKWIENWGRYPKIEANFEQAASYSDFSKEIQNHSKLIARGNGRSYGDSSLSEDVLSTISHNKILSFDNADGILCCQAGVLLSEIIDFALPKGYFLPVSPGTKFITAGGALAANIHGKNHHNSGCFSDHVLSFELVNSKGEHLLCSASENEELFHFTAGAMGLTGIISKVCLRLKSIESSYIKQVNIKASNLKEVMALFEAHSDADYSVAWLDVMQNKKSLGRSIFMLGEHVPKKDLPSKFQKDTLKLMKKNSIEIPEMFPSFLLNNLGMKVFNFFYYHKQLNHQKSFVGHYENYFYPLDRLLHWNRMYGKNGFVQYQFVLPLEHSFEGISSILLACNRLKLASFLTVLKLFGKENTASPLSFPMEGYTLTMDFKIDNLLFTKLNELDELVLKYGGRIYLAKDARMSREMFQKTYPFEIIQEKLNKYNGDGHFSSLQSKRLGLSHG